MGVNVVESSDSVHAYSVHEEFRHAQEAVIKQGFDPCQQSPVRQEADQQRGQDSRRFGLVSGREEGPEFQEVGSSRSSTLATPTFQRASVQINLGLCTLFSFDAYQRPHSGRMASRSNLIG